jgi:hypothetical protein
VSTVIDGLVVDVVDDADGVVVLVVVLGTGFESGPLSVGKSRPTTTITSPCNFFEPSWTLVFEASTAFNVPRYIDAVKPFFA